MPNALNECTKLVVVEYILKVLRSGVPVTCIGADVVPEPALSYFTSHSLFSLYFYILSNRVADSIYSAPLQKGSRQAYYQISWER